MEEWVLKVKQHFDFYGVLEEQRIRTAPFHLDEAAYDWWLDRKSSKNYCISSEEFLEAIQLRFKATIKSILEDITQEMEPLMKIEEPTIFYPSGQEEK